MKDRILHELMGSDGYVSGQALSERLGVSRAAIWKHIRALREGGAKVQAHTNAGYKLTALPDLLRPEYVQAHMERAKHEIRWLREVDSTNDEAKRWAQQGAPDGGVVIAERQTGGKGRLHRQWQSQRGMSVEMTMVLRPELPPKNAPAINFAAALGVRRAIREVCGVDVGIKWPNDIVFEGKKLCGILTEMTADMDHIEYAVCGMGVNVNQASFSDEISDRAVSLCMITGGQVDRLALCAAEIKWVWAYYKAYADGGMPAILTEYIESSVLIGENVRVLMGEKSFLGVCEGFEEDGAIIVKADGKRHVLNAGEVSIRGESDYV